MAAKEAPDLDALFEKLYTCIKNHQHKKALKAADEILAVAPKDEDALKAKVIAQLQLSQFEDAIAFINKSSLGPAMAFEKAYCLYRLGRIEEALEAVRGSGPDKAEAARQLEAQLFYRLGRNKDCIQVYDKLFHEQKVDSLELKTNVLAAYVAASLASEIPDLMAAMKVTAKQSFEVAFNKACGLVESGQYAAAETELRLALKLGRETLFEEDCSEEEVEVELAPLTVQLAYVVGRLKRHGEAQELYEQVLRNPDMADEATRIVALNNSMSESGRMDSSATHKKAVSNAIKRLEAIIDKDKPASLKLVPTLEARLSAHQKHVLHLNRALAYLTSGRNDAAKELAAALAKQQPDSHLVALLRAALLVADGKIQDADSLLEQYSTSYPASSLHPTLMRAQLALEANAAQRGLDLLAGVRDPVVAWSGGLLATRLALHQQLGDTAGAEALIDAATNHWRQQQRSGAASEEAVSTALGWCLQSAVGLKLKMGKVAESIAAFKQLQAGGMQSSSMAGVLGRLIRAVSSSDPQAAAQLEKELPALGAGESRGLDLDSLEDLARYMGSLRPAKKEAEASKKRDADGMEVEQQPQKKKVRRKHKPRLPKGWNPELPNGGLPPADPERWLPKWQRADFKRKKKSQQRKQDVVKGSQGAGKVDESLDRTKAAEPKAEAKSAKPTLPARPAKGKGKR
mmetsp:Transcript_17379/g.37521  ORF Transcript_17379/g.37521 Transcript_17379/m.37521 type:complete len:686 (+) Transcript_17379:137-2194(+)|eukprot:CAMPEP_0202900856 /NCGR_PEP_ID=MMETSP1392-20130828/12068_1 /ASSEMBLY_ACC=CAM_ASM_000868 /TAXON_ID=225041 /ORGANISM="Chlamydomonas chlamydogama, Strain SAG 11-48b" /LENGTH=685 /DNA_ID=CAMNT_0049587309 /DNA_START=137 /DNA_END=2194 /DNA_ORIENTATION=-